MTELAKMLLSNGVTSISLKIFEHGCFHKNSKLPGGNYVMLDSTGMRDRDMTLFAKNALDLLPQVPDNILIQYHDEAIHTSYWSILLHFFAISGVKKVIVIDGGLNLLLTEDYFSSQIKWRHHTSEYFFARYHEDASYNDYMHSPIDEKRAKHFVSLARFPRRERLALTAQLLEAGLENKGTISCGWTENTGESNLLHADSCLWNFIPEHLHSRFPITLGDKAEQQHTLSPHIQNAVFNIVQESQPGINVYDNMTVPDSHVSRTNGDRLFFTEKSAKAYAMGQIPIFLSSPGYVHHLRQMGFDLFDDIIDHRYDRNDCIRTRIQLIVQQVEKLCKQDIGYWREYLKSNSSRLNRNRSLLMNFAMHLRNVRNDSIREFFNG
jgi:hypothetical protein